MALESGSKRKTGLLVSLFLLMLVAAAWPSPVQAGHPWFEGPGEGTMIQGPTLHGFGNLTFVGVEEQLVGYHEWREVVQTTYEREGSSQPASFGTTYDLITGLFTGSHHDHQTSIPMVGLPVLDEVLAYDIAHSGAYGSPGADIMLPESLLWGRDLFPGDTWSAQTGAWWGGDAETRVTIEAEDWEGPFTVYVTHKADAPATVFEWRLIVTNEDRVVASERTVRLEDAGTPRDASTWYDYPLVVVSAGGEPFRFEGRSDVALTNGQDRQMSFGAVGRTPDDPEPHPMFDIDEAAEAALGADHEAVRAFRSKAVDPYLASAMLSGVGLVDASVTWYLHFQEAAGNGLDVRLYAEKTPWTPLLVHDVQAEPTAPWAEYLPPEARANTTTVHPGSYARYLDVFAAERNRFATTYDWGLEGWSGGGFTFAGGELAALHRSPANSCTFSVHVTGDTGVVRQSSLFSIGYAPALPCSTADPYAPEPLP